MHAFRIHPVEWLQEGFTAGFHVPLIADAASRRGLCTGRVFHSAQRPVERAPA